jgi:hypothetical protein
LERLLKIERPESDFENGLLLINLLEIASSKTIHNYNKKPKIRAQRIENAQAALQFLTNEGVKLEYIVAEGKNFLTRQLLNISERTCLHLLNISERTCLQISLTTICIVSHVYSGQ